MTPEKLAELEKLEAAATPEDVRVKWDSLTLRPAVYAGVDDILCTYPKYAHATADAKLYAALRNNARDLFAALREAWRKIESLEAQLDFVNALHDVAVKERDLARIEITLLRTELRKQVFASKVVFDRDVCTRAEAQNPDKEAR